MTLSISEIVLLTSVTILGVAAIVTSNTKITTDEPKPLVNPVTTHSSHPKNIIVIEEID
jgi:hypothetical protein